MVSKVRPGAEVIIIGRFIGGATGHVVRTRRVLRILGFALVQIDSGRLLRGRQFWMSNSSLVVVSS